MKPESIAIATDMQEANATEADATLLEMQQQKIQEWRRKRLASLAEKTGGKAELGRKLGFKDGAFVGQMIRGDRPITEKTILAVHAMPGYANWFDYSPAAQSPYANVEPGPETRGKVPLVSWVQAGAWCEAFTQLHTSEVERWLDCPVRHSPETFALRVRGDSMTAPTGNGRTYPEGCIIFVDPERRNPVNGDRIVACLLHANEVTFKVYKNEDGRQWLQPLNPLHEPIREPFKVLGTVLGKWEDG